MPDAVTICGPKSSRVTFEAIQSDPFLSFATDEEGRWVIKDRYSGQELISGIDSAPREPRDLAYIGRLSYRGTSMFIIAGTHAIGSVGAVHYFAGHAAELYAEVGDGSWSAIVGSTHDGETTIIESELVCPARRHG